MPTVTYWTALLTVLLQEIGTSPALHEIPDGGADLTFFYSHDGHAFTGVAHVMENHASVEFWLGHYSKEPDTLTQWLERVNENPIMIEESERWMRFHFAKNHLGFIAQLTINDQGFSERIMERRLLCLLELMKKELPTLLFL